MTDEDAIRSTVADYFEGWFEGDPARMERALHPGLAKRALREGTLDEATAAGMVDATRAGVGTRYPPEKRGFEVTVTDVHDGIASVVVHSQVYREYLHLARADEGWKIVNALWDLA
jgi:hypothetical protein